MNIFDKSFFTILGVAGALILVSIPLALQMIPRNGIYGYRTRATLTSDAVWYPANAYFGKTLISSTLIGMALAILLYHLRLVPQDLMVPLTVAFIALPSLYAVIATQCYIKKLKEEHQSD